MGHVGHSSNFISTYASDLRNVFPSIAAPAIHIVAPTLGDDLPGPRVCDELAEEPRLIKVVNARLVEPNFIVHKADHFEEESFPLCSCQARICTVGLHQLRCAGRVFRVALLPQSEPLVTGRYFCWVSVDSVLQSHLDRLFYNLCCVEKTVHLALLSCLNIFG